MQSVTTTEITAGKRTDTPAVVCRERHQNQELLLSTAQSPETIYPVCTGSHSADCTAAVFGHPNQEERSAYLTADLHYTMKA